MSLGRIKSKSFRKVFVKTPGGRNTVHYRKAKPSIAKCAKCKKPLSGIKRSHPGKSGRVAKSSRRPERPFGGNLCSHCTREHLRNVAREEK